MVLKWVEIHSSTSSFKFIIQIMPHNPVINWQAKITEQLLSIHVIRLYCYGIWYSPQVAIVTTSYLERLILTAGSKAVQWRMLQSG
jgi:hypothetical protein